MLKSKIHRASVTLTDIDYEGSIMIDAKLMHLASIREYEKVSVLNVSNGERFDTYAFHGKDNSGVISVNGAAARLVVKGDILIILAYASYTEQELLSHKPHIVFVDSRNLPKQ